MGLLSLHLLQNCIVCGLLTVPDCNKQMAKQTGGQRGNCQSF